VILVLRHAFAIAALPVTAAILVPLWVTRRYGVTFRIPDSPLDWTCVAVAVVLFVAGLTLFVSTLYLFATRGRGTLAPWDPPRHLVAAGPYRFVRNPMISGVLLVIVSEALVLRSLPHAQWGFAFLLINMVYIPLVEEPLLETRFGDEYRAYKHNVPRLLPRLTPWSR
jgi:protein-S-isoprenylcysteine O-methyltransferase Ste14